MREKKAQFGYCKRRGKPGRRCWMTEQLKMYLLLNFTPVIKLLLYKTCICTICVVGDVRMVIITRCMLCTYKISQSLNIVKSLPPHSDMGFINNKILINTVSLAQVPVMYLAATNKKPLSL